MAIPAQSLALVPGAPGPTVLSASGQPAQGPGDWQEPFAVGKATFVLDGTLTVATINWIDGSAALPFTPSACLAFYAGGTQALSATFFVAGVTVTNATSGVVQFGAAGTNTNTVIVFFQLFK